jgi:NAD(P)-dependent dehydrogenase (short-subunit alcohol dehydrogenase family)
LLRAGAIVIGTTRSPDKAKLNYKEYSDYGEWADLIDIYPGYVDLDHNNLTRILEEMKEYIDHKYGKLDVIVNCAAQTIRVREKGNTLINEDTEENRYGDAKFVAKKEINSWQMGIEDLEQVEMEEVYRVNAIAPTLIVQTFLPLLTKSDVSPYIINVHAKEGLIDVSHKSRYHIHLNMAKSAMSMLTRGLVDSHLVTHEGKPFSIHGSDPGWISVDEYYEEPRPWVVPPLDEIDGASRILYPLFKKLSSCRKTRRHYTTLTY